MKKVTAITSAAALTVLVAGSVTGTALAWHPVGKITKSVQNVTANGAVSAADTAATAVSAKPGDVLQYTIEIKNVGEARSDNKNDLAFTTMADSLPTGVELVSDPAKRVLTENLGTIKPGKSVVKTYKVKVTESVDGKVVVNKACFAGDSAIKDSPQSGCDVANIKVSNPPVVTPPVEEPPVEEPGKGEETPVVEEQEEELPAAGIGVFAPIAAAAAAVSGFAVNTLRHKRAGRKS